MSSANNPPFYPVAIVVATACIWLAVAIFAWNALTHGTGIFNWLMPVLMTIAMLGMKGAAPRTPFVELGLGIVLIYGVSFATDILALQFSPLFWWIGNKLIPMLCVFIVGHRWIKKGYIPTWCNWWPR